jgi:hypothetical protein
MIITAGCSIVVTPSRRLSMASILCLEHVGDALGDTIVGPPSQVSLDSVDREPGAVNVPRARGAVSHLHRRPHPLFQHAQ